MRISDWSSDVLLFRSLPGEALLDDAAPEDQDIDPRILPSSGGVPRHGERRLRRRRSPGLDPRHPAGLQLGDDLAGNVVVKAGPVRADRKSTRLNFQSLMRISYAVFCLKKKI